MTLDRRSFLQWTAAAGLSVTASPFSRQARAAEPWDGPFWVTIHASGGWDPTMLCDPKGRLNELATDPVNNFFIDDIEQVGAFHVAPIPGHVEFFERFRNDLLVINGVDSQTNSHETGTRFTWSGRMDPGSPALSALVAAAPAQRPSLSYLTHGGYDLTSGLVAPTRLPDTNSILEIAYPDRTKGDDPDSTIVDARLMRHIHRAQADRLQRLTDRSTLPREQRALSRLLEARTGDDELTRLSEVLPSDLSNSSNQLLRQAQVSMACFKAGVSVATSMSIGGFDTHGDHDNDHTRSMSALVEGISFLYDEAERQGIADRLIVVVGSDFGRTPWYNATNGKDHWSVTSMMMMGPGIRGGRVIGASDERQVPLTVNPNTLALDPNGIRITPAHIHASLRKLAGVDTWTPAARFGVGELLPLLS